MPTVADVLRRIERIKKDLEYVRGLEEKWREQKERFPRIFEGILAQKEAFEHRIENLRNLGVESDDPELYEAPKASRTESARDEPDTDDEPTRGAAAAIAEKLRSRQPEKLALSGVE